MQIFTGRNINFATGSMHQVLIHMTILIMIRVANPRRALPVRVQRALETVESCRVCGKVEVATYQMSTCKTKKGKMIK